jgi:hypothetical protein
MDSLTLQKQIELLQSQMVPLRAQAMRRVETLEETVKRVLQKELAKETPAENVEPAAESVSMLSAVGSALTEAQQQWLSLAENQECIPEFFMTSEGQAITRRFITAYQEYKCT